MLGRLFKVIFYLRAGRFLAANGSLKYSLLMPALPFLTGLMIPFLLLFFASCVEQAPPKIGTPFERSAEEAVRDGACRHVRLDAGLLEHQNLVKFFQCTTWNGMFPALYSSLSQIDSQKWNHLLLPIDGAFYAPRERREKFFQEVKRLDQNHGLDELDPLLGDLLGRTSFNGENIIKVLNSVLVLSANEAGIHKEDVHKFLEVINSDPATIKDALNLALELSKAFKLTEKDFTGTLIEVLNGPRSVDFRTRRKWLVDELARLILRTHPAYEHRVLLPRLLITPSPGQEKPWFHHWISSAEMDLERFTGLLSFSYRDYPTLSADLRSLSEYFETGLACKVKGQAGKLKLNIKKQFIDYSKKMGSLDQASFLEYSLGTTSQILQSESACEVGTSLLNPAEGPGVNILVLIKNLAQFLEDGKFFELTNFASAIVNFNNGPEDPGAPLFLVDMIKSDFFERLSGLNELLIEGNKKPITQALLPFLKSVPVKSYPRIARLLKKILENDNYEVIKSAAKIWLHMEEGKKEFLLALVDQVIKLEVNLSQQIAFLLNLSIDLPQQLVELSPQLASGPEQRERTFLALAHILSFLDRPEVRVDLEKFFSRQHVLKLVEILSSGTSAPPVGHVPYDEDFSRELERDGVRLRDPPVTSSLQVRKLSDCLQALAALGSLEATLAAFPIQCRGVDSTNFAFNTLLWLDQIQEDYRQFTHGHTSIFDSNGLMSRASMHEGLTTLKILDQILSADPVENGEGGFIALLSVIKKHILELDIVRKDGGLQRGLLRTLESLLAFYVEFVQVLGENEKKYFDGLLLELSRLPENEIKAYLTQLSFIINDYSHFKHESKTYVQTQSCAQAFAIPQTNNPILSGYGVNPCPEKREIQRAVRSILVRAKMIHENGPPFLENLLALVHPDGGIKIPFESSNQHIYQLKLKDLFMFSWDMADKNKNRDANGIFTSDRSRAAPLQVEFFHTDGSFVSQMDGASLLEVVIRDISFTGNFYGIVFQNEAARAEDYSDATRFSDLSWRNITYLYNRTKMLRDVMAPRYRNSGTLPAETEWLLKNVLNTFQGLHYVADTYEHRGVYQGINYDFGTTSYRDLMQAFLTLQVMTSSKTSRDFYGMDTSPVSPHTELGLSHNSLVMVEAMNISSIRNISRFLRDRISQHEKPYFDFLNSYNFNRVDTKLLRKFQLANLQKSIRKLVDENASVNNRNLYILSDDIISWLYDSSYNELRHLENVGAYLALIGTYIGEDDEFPEFRRLNQDITLDHLIENLNALMQSYPAIKFHWPADLRLHELIPVLEKQLALIVQGLSPEENDLDRRNFMLSCPDGETSCRSRFVNERRKIYYGFLNKTYRLISRVALRNDNELRKSGLAVILDKVNAQAERWVFQISQQVDGIYRYFARIHKNERTDRDEDLSGFNVLARNLFSLVNHPNFSLSSLLAYLQNVSTEFIGTGPGLRNPHFREFETFASFLIKKDPAGKSNLEKGARTLLEDNYSSLRTFLNDTLSLLEFDETPPVPFAPPSNR